MPGSRQSKYRVPAESAVSQPNPKALQPAPGRLRAGGLTSIMHERPRELHRSFMSGMHKSLICFGLLVTLLGAARAQQPAPPDSGLSLSDQLVQQVLEPLRNGMQTQNIQLVLSVFDKQELESYSDLEGQLRAFFQMFDQVDLRYQLLQATADQKQGSATAEMQMDALPYERSLPAARRSAQMRLKLKLGPSGWRIASFTPEDFFNVEYAQK